MINVVMGKKEWLYTGVPLIHPMKQQVLTKETTKNVKC